jgi:hypothetical protein
MATPVKRIKRGDVVNASIIAMKVHEITSSATKATASPADPGTVIA